MVVQETVIKALSSTSIYPKGVNSVEIKETEFAFLFITSKYVYKLKKELKKDRVDFSTSHKRKQACLHEMHRSTIYAPNLIKGIKPIRMLKNGRIKIGGQSGEEVDTILVMDRLAKDALLDEILPNENFGIPEVLRLVQKLVDLHGKSKIFKTKGGASFLEGRIRGVTEALEQHPDIFKVSQVYFWSRTLLSWLEQYTHLIQIRQKSGRFRKCHGNLFLSNISYSKQKFLFFSPIEYDDSLECIDVLYDLSALLVDFEVKGLRDLVNVLFNTYIALTNDIEGLPLLPLYQSLRAALRATAYVSGNQEQQLKAQAYFQIACQQMTLVKPSLVITDQSLKDEHIASRIEPFPGALILKEGVLRRQITGFSKKTWFNKTQGISLAFDKIVYEVLKQQVQMALDTGFSVVVQLTKPTDMQIEELKKLAQLKNISTQVLVKDKL